MRNAVICSSHSQTAVRSRVQDTNDVIVRAFDGDRDAIAAIAISFGHRLRSEARAVLGPFRDEAEDIVQELLASLVEGRSVFTPERKRAVSWMMGVVRSAARRRRAEQEEAWAWRIEKEP